MRNRKQSIIKKQILALSLIFALILSSASGLKSLEVSAAARYNPSGAWRGTNEVAGGLLSISMYTSEDGGNIVGNWQLDNYYGHSEGIITKTSDKNKYKLVYAPGMDETYAGSTYFIMKMKSNKKLKLTARKYDSKAEWSSMGFNGIFKLSQRYKS